MQILGIETSCDETSAAIVEKQGQQTLLTANIVASSLAIHKTTGGIIPENAAREQIKYILPVIKEALTTAQTDLEAIDAIAVTYGPGLIGSLLVGVETAKTLAFVLNKPLIPVNHMVGHIYANWIDTNTVIARSKSDEAIPSERLPRSLSVARNDEIEFPALALVVSGGHTDLLLMKQHGDFTLLGGTRDDAAGEAFDKIARLLGLAYPGGPVIENRAKLGNAKKFTFPRPLVGSGDYDFSFSGLKTAVLREVNNLRHSGKRSAPRISHTNKNDSGVLWTSQSPQNDQSLDDETINDICAGVQQAITSVLIKKTLKAAAEHHVTSILLSGGVAANQTLKETFEQKITDELPTTKFFVPAKNLCTDNGAMIAAAAAYNYHPVSWQDITADPELYFD
jgi:N6-L-threonylcarbamoyladenine synthase